MTATLDEPALEIPDELAVGQAQTAPLVRFSVSDEMIAAAKARHAALVALPKPPPDDIRSELTTLVRCRTTIDRERKFQNEAANEHIRLVNLEAKRRTGQLAPMETDLQTRWDSIQAEKDRIRREKEDAERKAIEAAIQAKRDAEDAAAKAIRDAKEAELKAEAERQAAERAKLDALKKQIEEHAAAAKAKAEAEAKIEREREEAARKERERIESERLAAERVKFEAEQKAAKEKAERDAAEAKRLEAMRPDREKLKGYAEKLRTAVIGPQGIGDEARAVLLAANAKVNEAVKMLNDFAG